MDGLRTVYADARLRTEVLIFLTRGRKVAIEAAMIPVPGSAVAQMVALTDIALSR